MINLTLERCAALQCFYDMDEVHHPIRVSLTGVLCHRTIQNRDGRVVVMADVCFSSS